MMIIIDTRKLPSGAVQATGRDEHGRTYSVVVPANQSTTDQIVEALTHARANTPRAGEGV